MRESYIHTQNTQTTYTHSCTDTHTHIRKQNTHARKRTHSHTHTSITFLSLSRSFALSQDAQKSMAALFCATLTIVLLDSRSMGSSCCWRPELSTSHIAAHRCISQKEHFTIWAKILPSSSFGSLSPSSLPPLHLTRICDSSQNLRQCTEWGMCSEMRRRLCCCSWVVAATQPQQ